jgi:hypothetical protein
MYDTVLWRRLPGAENGVTLAGQNGQHSGWDGAFIEPYRYVVKILMQGSQDVLVGVVLVNG